MPQIHWKIKHVLNVLIFPICFGGCPHKRIENIFKDKHYDTCTYLKGSLKEFIKIHLSQNS